VTPRQTEHGFLAGELLLHQGCVRDQGLQDGGVDGPLRNGHF